MSDVSVIFKGQEVTSFSESATLKLHTGGDYCEDDIRIVYVRPSGGEVIPLTVTANGTYTAPSGVSYNPVTVNVQEVHDLMGPYLITSTDIGEYQNLSIIDTTKDNPNACYIVVFETANGTADLQMMIIPAGELSIIENGEYDVSQYATVDINTPGPKEEEVKQVEIYFEGGEQEILPTTGKVMNKVIALAPSSLIAANIKKDVDVAGVIGSYEGEYLPTSTTITANGTYVPPTGYAYTEVAVIVPTGGGGVGVNRLMDGVHLYSTIQVSSHPGKDWALDIGG